jgi:hypothetical protein
MNLGGIDTMPILGAVMVLSLVAGVYEAWRGNMGRCVLFVAVGLAIAGYVVLQSFVPGARK